MDGRIKHILLWKDKTFFTQLDKTEKRQKHIRYRAEPETGNFRKTIQKVCPNNPKYHKTKSFSWENQTFSTDILAFLVTRKPRNT